MTGLEAFTLIFSACATVVGGVLVALIQRNTNATKEATTAARRAAKAADDAADCLDPTTSTQILEAVTEVRTELRDHRRETQRDIGGLREEMRLERRERMQLDARVSDHIERNQ